MAVGRRRSSFFPPSSLLFTTLPLNFFLSLSFFLPPVHVTACRCHCFFARQYKRAKKKSCVFSRFLSPDPVFAQSRMFYQWAKERSLMAVSRGAHLLWHSTYTAAAHRVEHDEG